MRMSAKITGSDVAGSTAEAKTKDPFRGQYTY